jgi:hypothetical protein
MVIASFRIKPEHLEYLRMRAGNTHTVSDTLREILDVDREMWLQMYDPTWEPPKVENEKGPVTSALLQSISAGTNDSRS